MSVLVKPKAFSQKIQATDSRRFIINDALVGDSVPPVVTDEEGAVEEEGNSNGGVNETTEGSFH